MRQRVVIAETADRVAVMYAGRIVEEAETETLIVFSLKELLLFHARIVIGTDF